MEAALHAVDAWLVPTERGLQSLPVKRGESRGVKRGRATRQALPGQRMCLTWG